MQSHEISKIWKNKKKVKIILKLYIRFKKYFKMDHWFSTTFLLKQGIQ